MAKRGIITSDKFRISPPGVDVDTAKPEQLLLHENMLYSQPYFFSFVACPFAGYIGNESRVASVDVVVPPVSDNPMVLVYPVSSEDLSIWPLPRAQGPGNPQNGYNLEYWSIGYRVLSASQISIIFEKSYDSYRSPLGAHIVLTRSADA